MMQSDGPRRCKDCRGRQPRLAPFLYGCLLAGIVCSQAVGQQLLPDKVGVRDRPKPEYEPIGVRIGLLNAYPRLSVRETYDDNIFATEGNQVNDGITALAGDLAIRSNGRTPWSVFGNVAQYMYAEHSDEDYANLTGGMSIGRAIGSRLQAGLSVSYARLHESRGDPSIPIDVIELPEFDTARAELDLTYAYARGRLNLRSSLDTFDYADGMRSDGSIFDQDFRNRDMWDVTLRNDFGIGPKIGLFLQLQHKEQRYENAGRSAEDIDRDATTNALYAGTALWISDLVRGDVGVGVLEVNNRDPTQEDRRTIGLNASLEYYVTQLLSASITARRDSGPSDIAESASYVATTGALGVDYELRRNVLVTANYSYSRREYSGIEREDTVSKSGLQVQWMVNRRARASMGFALEEREWPVAAAGRDYRRRTVFAAVTFML